MLVTHHLENSVIQFQSGGLCPLTLLSPYFHTDSTHEMEMYFPRCCTYRLWLYALLSPSVGPPLSGCLKLGRHLIPML